MASKEELLQNIKPGMKLTWDFFKKIYGYEISFPGFAEIALKALEDAGSTHSRQHYEKFVSDYEEAKRKELQPVAFDYVEKLEAKWKKEQKEREKLLAKKKQNQLKMSKEEFFTQIMKL